MKIIIPYFFVLLTIPQIGQAATMDKSFDDFVNCSKAAALKYAVLQESADVVARTAVFSCIGMEIANLRKSQEFNIITAEQQAGVIQKTQAIVEPIALKTVMDYRLSKLPH